MHWPAPWNVPLHMDWPVPGERLATHSIELTNIKNGPLSMHWLTSGWLHYLGTGQHHLTLQIIMWPLIYEMRMLNISGIHAVIAGVFVNLPDNIC
jgi:hypothetical protein